MLPLMTGRIRKVVGEKTLTPNKVLMTKWPQRNCQNKDALGRSNGLQHTCGKYNVGNIGRFPDIKYGGVGTYEHINIDDN